MNFNGVLRFKAEEVRKQFVKNHVEGQPAPKNTASQTTHAAMLGDNG